MEVFEKDALKILDTTSIRHDQRVFEVSKVDRLRKKPRLPTVVSKFIFQSGADAHGISCAVLII